MKKIWMRPEVMAFGDVKQLTQGPGSAIGKCPGAGDDFSNQVRDETVDFPCSFAS